MNDKDKELAPLYAQLGMLLVQAEILGTLTIPNKGQIGAVKAQIAKILSTPPVPPVPPA